MADTGQYSDSTPSGNILILNIPAERAKAEAAYTRRIIRKSDFTRAEKDVLIKLIGLWFYHRNGRKGFIHPGRDKLAKAAKASDKTVQRALSVFRDLDFIKAMRYAKGGTGCATQYLVNIRTIWDFIDPENVQMMPGELVLIRRQTGTFAPQNDPVNVPVSGGQNVPLSKDTHRPEFDGEGPCQECETDTAGGAA